MKLVLTMVSGRTLKLPLSIYEQFDEKLEKETIKMLTSKANDFVIINDLHVNKNLIESFKFEYE